MNYNIIILNIIMLVSFSTAAERYKLKHVDEFYLSYLNYEAPIGYKILTEDELYDCQFDFAYLRMPEKEFNYSIYKTQRIEFCENYYYSKNEHYINKQMVIFRESIDKLVLCLGIIRDNQFLEILRDNLNPYLIAIPDKNIIKYEVIQSEFDYHTIEDTINSKLCSNLSEADKTKLLMCTGEFEESMEKYVKKISLHADATDNESKTTFVKTNLWIKFETLQILARIIEGEYQNQLNLIQKMFYEIEFSSTEKTAKIEECKAKTTMEKPVFQLTIF
ncbi:Hypothetical protein CINCED_3A015956, partial [Cinara cedri]